MLHETTDPPGTLNICRVKAFPSGHKAVDRVTTFAAVAVIILPEASCRFIFIAPKRIFCEILFGFPQRAITAQDATEKGLTGRVLKLMGNVWPARQEAFLTLMERGMRRGGVGGGGDRARFTGSQTPAELQ